MQGSNFQYCVLNLFASRSGVCARLPVCVYLHLVYFRQFFYNALQELPISSDNCYT